jgi:holo-[acyl-carrier protein] synthase
MIIGIGTDIVQIDRLNMWAKASTEKLLKIYSLSELADCKNSEYGYSAQKLATRFAAKEAFYKALSSALVFLKLTGKEFSFLFSSQHIHVYMDIWGVPVLHVNWNAFEKKIDTCLPDIRSHVSLSHESVTALAFVVLSV